MGTRVTVDNFDPEDGSTMPLQNVGVYLQDYTVSQPRQRTEESPLWEPQNV
jgi:hypothetical protein